MCFIGIILVDPPINDSYFVTDKEGCIQKVHLTSEPFTGGFEDFLDPPSVHDDNPGRPGPGRQSLLEDILYYWSVDPSLRSNIQDPPILSLACYPLRIVASEWMNYIAVMRFSIKEYEYSHDEAPGLIHQLNKLNEDLQSLQRWRRRGMSSRAKIRNTTRFLKVNLKSDENSELWSSLIEDYEHIAVQLDEHSLRMESMLPVVASLVQIVDSRRSFTETANVSRLTILALIFVPLSFTSSLFSMNDEIGPGGNQFWVYFAVSVPMTLAVLFIAKPPFKVLHSCFTAIITGKRSYEVPDKGV